MTPIDVHVEGCTYELDRAPGLTLHLHGMADAPAAEGLKALFAALHDECIRTSSHELRIDLRDLELLSPSCFNVIVSWILRIEALPIPERYRIVVVPSFAHAWQRTSLRALAAMGPGVIVLEGEPPA